MKFKIIDLFAGIGGIRLGFEKAAKKKLIETNCVFSSEIDKYCIQTYITNFGKTNFYGDITKLGSAENIIKTIPNFNLLFTLTLAFKPVLSFLRVVLMRIIFI